MSDRAVVAAAVFAFLGALHPTGVGSWAMVLLCSATAVCMTARWTPITVILVMVVVSGLSHRAWSAVDAPVPLHVEGRATLLSDPERFGATTSAVVEVGRTRYLARAWGGAGWALAGLDAGSRIEISGTSSAYEVDRGRRAALRTAHRLQLSSLDDVDGGVWYWRIANGLRSLIESGASSLDSPERSLLTGLVYGDDRNQDPLVAADFRSAGLTHLLAVSGQNVAYVLTLVGPLMRRLGPRARWSLALCILALFATVTRFEPSVMRASVMAGIAVTGRFLGREAPPLRSLALAIFGLLVIDPLLAWTLAFRLSVAASAGIVVLSPLLVARLRGPAWLRDPLAVTLGAQLAVAPILIATFGPVSVATIPANLLAGPVAGLAMMWGMTAGVVAGLLGGGAASALHVPTSVCIWWLESVARQAATSPLPRLGAAGFLVAAGLAGLHRRLPRGTVVVFAVVVLAASTAMAEPAGWHRVGWDSILVGTAEKTLIVGRELSVVTLLDDLNEFGIVSIDTIIVTDQESMPAMATLSGRIRVGSMWSPRPTAISVGVREPRELRVAGRELRVEPREHGLDVYVRGIG